MWTLERGASRTINHQQLHEDIGTGFICGSFLSLRLDSNLLR